MKQSPNETEKGILETLVKYFKKTMPVHEAVGARARRGGESVNDPTCIAKKLEDFLRGGLHGEKPYQAGLLQEQYVEQIVPYAMSDKSLLETGLEPHVADAFARYLAGPKKSGGDVHPYEHQEKVFTALRTPPGQGGKRHAIVCSGTGSGKTESFLMPVIDGIVRDKLEHPDRKGIRALILYPMNALVEDQIRRIRGIVHELARAGLPDSAIPTFGSFTGRLEHRDEDRVRPECAVNALFGEDRRWPMENQDSDGGVASLGAVVGAKDPHEFRDREAYAEGGPDILITNTSMLQRLLLRPDMDCLFNPSVVENGRPVGSTWKYIVLDEAHSYTGASGTEIAWLVRRLLHRIQGEDMEVAKTIRDGIHFLATSATLYKRREAPDPSADTPVAAAERLALDKEDTAKGFGVRIFPIRDWRDIAVEFGRQLEVDDVCEKTPLYPETKKFSDLMTSVGPGSGADDTLFDRTVAWMAERDNLKRRKEVADFLRRRFGDFNDGTCNLIEAATIVARVQINADEREIPLNAPGADARDVVQVDDNVKHLVKFVLGYFGDSMADANSPWRVMLHDPLDKNSPAEDANQENVLDGWIRIANDPERGPDCLKGFELAYLYVAVMEAATALVRPEQVAQLGDLRSVSIENECMDLANVDLAARLSSVKVCLHADLLGHLRSYVERTEQMSGTCNAESTGIQREWEALLGVPMNKSESLENYFHRVFSGREDVRAVYTRLKAGFCSAGELCKAIGGDKDELFGLLQICLIATKRGLRSPVINSRYHQMVRGIWDVAVRFPSGRLESLEVVRSPANTLADGHPDAGLFTLGVCRECGQPYLIGYTKADIQDGSPQFLMRSESPTYGLMHAFAWVCGSDEEAARNDKEQAEPDRDLAGANARRCPPIFVNLLTAEAITGSNYGYRRRNGEISDADNGAWVEMVWHRVAQCDGDVTQSSFVTECPNCRRTQRREGTAARKFGVITPYEAFDQQVKIELLEEFVSKSMEDPDPAIRVLPGHGKKVLAFSDSRNQASTFSQKFDETYYNKYYISAINAIVREARQIDSETVEMLRDEICRWQKNLNEARSPAARSMAERRLKECEDNLRRMQREGKSLSEVSEELREKMRAHQLQDMLVQTKLDGENYGQRLDLSESAKLTVMLMLRDYGRSALLRRDLVKLRYDDVGAIAERFRAQCGPINGFSQEEMDRITGNGEAGAERLERLLNGIYQWIVHKAFLLEGDTDGRRDSVWRPSRCQNWALCLLRTPAGRAARGMQEGEYCNFTGVRKLQRLVRDYLQELGIGNLADNGRNRGISKILEAVYETLRHKEVIRAIPGDGQRACGVSIDTIVEHTVLVPGEGTRRGAESPDEADTLIDDADFIRIEEHTAQISPLLGEAYQRGFSAGRINVLSCSTTFEMGVDVGALSRVMMMNVPPLTANYRQRAGRAGRRPGAAAYILTFAQNNPTENHFFEAPLEMYDGKIDPPEIYLKVKPFWSRQIRTSALHDFLSWWQSQPGERGRGRSEVDWNKTGRFFGERDENGIRVWNEGNGRNRRTHGAVVGDLAEWIDTDSARQSDESARRLIEENLTDEERVQIDIHSASKDLFAQMLGIVGWNPGLVVPYPLTNDNYIRYEELSGPLLPKVAGDLLVSDDNELRKSALVRVCARQNDLRHRDFDLRKYNGEEAIKRFGDLSIVPLNGFPVDVVRAVPEGEVNGRRRDNRYVERLERPLEQGLYEYAPGRVVRANKRTLQIVGYRSERGCEEGVFVCRGNGGCGEVFLKASHPELRAGGRCPVCQQGTLREMDAERPKEFLYEPVTRAEEGAQGARHIEFCGKLRNPIKHESLQLFVSEPDTMMMRYYNAGPDGKGYERRIQDRGGRRGRAEGRVLYHATMTNIVIWALPNIGQLFLGNGEERQERAVKALYSAAAAIRRAAARVLHVNDRDLDVILKRGYVNREKVEGWDDCLEGYPDCIVLFDVAKGGGGAVLPLTPQADGFQEKTSEVLDAAIRLCDECNCGGNSSQHPEWRPVTRAELNNQARDGEADGHREQCACPNCLRAPSNMRLEGLDRLDARAVLRLIKGDVEMVGWNPR